MNLAVKNNWEYLEWYVDKKQVEPNTIKRVEIGGEVFKVKWHMKSVDYSDMGHTYRATSPHGYIKKKVFGVFEEFSLSTLLQRHIITVKEMSQMSEEQLSQDDREHIDSLSRLDLCRIYRFAPAGHKYFIRDTPASDYFNKKFEEAGGFSPEISKQLGWST